MSTNHNVYSAYKVLKENSGATAAAVELVNAACSSDTTKTTQALDWAIEGDNLRKLRDKIKECASDG